MANSDFTFYVDEQDLRKINSIFIGYSNLEREAVIREALERSMDKMVSVGRVALKQTILHPAKSKGHLIKSMGTSYRVGNGFAKGTAGFKRSTRKNKIGGGNHSYLVDRGTRERWQKTTGKYTGSVRRNRPQTGSRFWTETVYKEGPKALDGLVQAIQDALDKINARM